MVVFSKVIKAKSKKRQRKTKKTEIKLSEVAITSDNSGTTETDLKQLDKCDSCFNSYLGDYNI